MKHKKAYVYSILVFLFMVSCFLSYCIGYFVTTKMFENKVSQQQTKEEKSNNNYVQIETVDVSKNNELIVNSATKYTVEVYDMTKNEITVESANVPAIFIGMTREDIIDYLDDYMNDLSLEEYQKGLVSYELIKFSSNELVVKKCYSSNFVTDKYYITANNGVITVYYSDKKSVYEYTTIKVDQLPSKDQQKIYSGIYVKDDEELYGLLENYSS